MAYKKEIIAGLRKKHKNTPKVVLEKVADHIETGVNEEDEVEAAVDGADGLVTMISGLVQTEGDKRVEDALKKNGIDPKKPKSGGEDDNDDPNPGETGNKTPEWAKGLTEGFKTMQEELKVLKEEKSQNSQLASLNEKIKDADQTFKDQTLKNFKRMKFDKPEDFEEYLAETEADLEAFNKNLSSKGLNTQTAPILGESTKEGVSTLVQNRIESRTNPEKATGGNLGGKQVTFNN
ncbi:hypothetical protein [Pedobacter panaciterrae]